MPAKKVTVQVMQKICDRLAEGETLVEIAKDKNLPSYRTITRSVQDSDEMWEMYRKGRILQAEYYADKLNGLAMSPLPENVDPRQLNAEVQRRRLEIDTLKWTSARNQPFGIRDKKEDQPQNAGFTISWAGNDLEVTAAEQVIDAADKQVVKH